MLRALIAQRTMAALEAAGMQIAETPAQGRGDGEGDGRLSEILARPMGLMRRARVRLLSYESEPERKIEPFVRFAPLESQAP